MDCKMESPLGFWGSEADEMLVGRFPLHKACRDGDPAALSRLVAEATRDQLVAEDKFYSWTPIHWAAYFGKNDCLNGLLQCGINVNIQTSKFQQTPAHIAAFGGHPITLCELTKAGADLHSKDYLGEIPLHKAARVGNVECLKLLVKNGTHVDICNTNGQSACDIARNQHFVECLHLLEQASQQQRHHQKFVNGTNGHHVLNGTSGSHMSNGNRHSNGFNGHSLNTVNRKRTFDDVSIPETKKARFAGCQCIEEMGSTMSAIRHPSQKVPSFCNGSFGVEGMDRDHSGSIPCHSESMQSDAPSRCAEALGSMPVLDTCPIQTSCDEPTVCEMEFQSPSDDHAVMHARKSGSSKQDDITRAPSPGMEINWHMGSDLQLWGHLHGYGDTAESIPDEGYGSPVQNVGSSHAFRLKGIQSRGWQ